MNSYLIKNARIVNEGTTQMGDVLIENGLITEVGSSIVNSDITNIDAKGKYLLPGMIDDQVHLESLV